jgi:hypothetical protein
VIVAGVKGKSGPVGNLNACDHPWRAFWRRRALRPQDKWAAAFAELYEAGLLSDKPDASEGERRVIELAGTARVCVVLILSESRRSGFIQQTKDGWDLTPGMKELARFMTVEQRCLQTLGLERRSKSVGTLQEYLESRAKAETKDSAGHGEEAGAERRTESEEVSTEHKKEGDGHDEGLSRA